MTCVSFSADGKLLATGGYNAIAYTWDVAAIIKKAGLNDSLSNSTAKKLALHSDATRRPVQRLPLANRVPHGFFDGVPPDRSHSSARSTFLARLFHRNPSGNYDTSLSSPLDLGSKPFKTAQTKQ
jgi:hypothetical protein